MKNFIIWVKCRWEKVQKRRNEILWSLWFIWSKVVRRVGPSEWFWLFLYHFAASVEHPGSEFEFLMFGNIKILLSKKIKLIRTVWGEEEYIKKMFYGPRRLLGLLLAISDIHLFLKIISQLDTFQNESNLGSRLIDASWFDIE